jgi:hypothetical protein
MWNAEFEVQLDLKMSPREPLLGVKGVFGMVNGVLVLVTYGAKDRCEFRA